MKYYNTKDTSDVERENEDFTNIECLIFFILFISVVAKTYDEICVKHLIKSLSPLYLEPMQSDIKPLAILAGDDGVLQSVNTPSSDRPQQSESRINLIEDAENADVKVYG